MTIERLHWRTWPPHLDASMGAWRSEVTLDRNDLPVLMLGAGTLTAAFLLGRWSA